MSSIDQYSGQATQTGMVKTMWLTLRCIRKQTNTKKGQLFNIVGILFAGLLMGGPGP